MGWGCLFLVFFFFFFFFFFAFFDGFLTSLLLVLYDRKLVNLFA